MNLKEKKKELILLIRNYLSKKASLEYLQKFAWELIEYFQNNSEKLPPIEDFEKEFWFAIWQIQHLADSEHEKDGLTVRELKNALDYLEKNKIFPKDYSATRP